MSTSPNTTLAEAAQMVADAELAAARALLAAAQTFADALAAIGAGLPFPAGYTSEARNIANGMAANLSFAIGNQLPQLIRRLTPEDLASPGAPSGTPVV